MRDSIIQGLLTGIAFVVMYGLYYKLKNRKK